MPFLSPNQQRQSPEGIKTKPHFSKEINIISVEEYGLV